MIERSREHVIRLAILAVGGQGGGVLTNWIVELARDNGYQVQATSVAGVAQRTGATIYYIEMLESSGRTPVFALAPAAGDVDIVIGAELMEAGRAILRGFVHPTRTTLIMSTHRMLAVSEKIVPGDGIAKSDGILKAANRDSKRLIAHDFERIAAEAGTVISASLFGALAGAGCLPFETSRFESVISASGRGADANLAAFKSAIKAIGIEDIARDSTASPDTIDSTALASKSPVGSESQLAQWKSLVARAQELPASCQQFAVAGLTKLVDYQDIDYGEEYLRRLQQLSRLDIEHGGEAKACAFSRECARQLANQMAYDDVLRVAQIKTRAERMARIVTEAGVDEAQTLRLTEYLHPRAQELCATLPRRLGAWLESKPDRLRVVDRLVNRGRRIRTDTILGFTLLYAVANLVPWRRKLRRHEVEQQFLESWLALACNKLASDYYLAVEVIRCRRLIKGYSDTLARGQSRYATVVAQLDQISALPNAAVRFKELVDAALADHTGNQLTSAINKLSSETLS